MHACTPLYKCTVSQIYLGEKPLAIAYRYSFPLPLCPDPGLGSDDSTRMQPCDDGLAVRAAVP